MSNHPMIRDPFGDRPPAKLSKPRVCGEGYQSHYLIYIEEIIIEAEAVNELVDKKQFFSLKAVVLQEIKRVTAVVREYYASRELNVEHFIDKYINIQPLIESLVAIAKYLISNAASFNFGYRRHESHNHWNKDGYYENISANEPTEVSWGGGLFFLTSFVGGNHPGYMGLTDQHTKRRGMFLAPTDCISPSGRKERDLTMKEYANRTCRQHFDIPVAFFANIKPQDIEDSDIKKYEAILAKECVPNLTNRKVFFC